MVIAFMQVELLIPDNRSLKGKRMVLRSIKDRIRNKYNVSISEIAKQDIWDYAILGIAYVGNEQKYASKIFSAIIEFIEKFHQIRLMDYCVEML